VLKKGLLMLLAVLLLVPVFAGGCAKEVVGDPIELTLSYPTGNPVRMASAELIKENLEAIGIKVNLDIMEFATLAEKVYDNVDFELYLMGWRLGADPDASGIWLKDMKWNAVGLDNPKSDELLLHLGYLRRAHLPGELGEPPLDVFHRRPRV